MSLLQRLRHSTALHVVLLGSLIGVALVLWRGTPRHGADTSRIVVRASDVQQLRLGWIRRWQKEPTRLELRAALEKHLRQEVFYREALARGFDRDDAVVRQTMQQKMEFLGETLAQGDPPRDEEIRSYYSLRRERYRVPGQVSFAQVFVSAEEEPDQAAQRALRLLEDLRSERPSHDKLGTWGDSSLLPGRLDRETETAVRSQFGDDFSQALMELPTDTWEGPVRSAYGLHLVFLHDREPSYVPEWPEIRPSLLRDMEYEARGAAREQFFQEIAQNYQIFLDDEAQSLVGADEE